MKQTWNSFLQTVFQSIKMLSASAPAKRRRDTAVLTAGIFLVTAITFAAGNFPETGNGAMVAFAETPGETGGQEEGTYDGNTDEEKRDPESIMAAEEAADTENGTEIRKEEAENGAETPEGGEAGEGEVLDQEAETAVEGSGAQEEAVAGEDSGAPEGEAAEASERAAAREGSGGQEGTASGESAEFAEGAAAQEASGTPEQPSVPETQEAAASVSLSDRDYQTLLKIVQAEAGNCDRLEIRDCYKVLPHSLIQTGPGKFVAEDRVSLTERLQTVTGDRSKAADAKSRTRERLTVYHFCRKAQLDTAGAYLILKQLL